MEFLEIIIYYLKVREQGENFGQLQLLLRKNIRLPVYRVIRFFGCQQVGGVFQELIERLGLFVILIDIEPGFQFFLVTDPHIVYCVIQALHDMEAVDAQDGVRKDPVAEFGKAAVHVTAEVLDIFPLMGRIVHKIRFQALVIPRGEDVDDRMVIPVHDIALEAPPPPSAAFRIKRAGISFEFVDADGCSQCVVRMNRDGIENAAYDSFRDAVIRSNLTHGLCTAEIRKDAVEQDLCDGEPWMDPIGSVSKRYTAVLAVKTWKADVHQRGGPAARNVVNDLFPAVALRSERIPFTKRADGLDVARVEGYSEFGAGVADIGDRVTVRDTKDAVRAFLSHSKTSFEKVMDISYEPKIY